MNDDDDDASVSDTRLAMGDPMHVRPAVAIYGGTEAAPVGTVYMPTNDGMLHAFDMQTGAELWASFPPNCCGASRHCSTTHRAPRANTASTATCESSSTTSTATASSIGSDKMYAIFGFGRGGSKYYALDVTTRTAPRFLWKKDERHDCRKLGEAWSAPVITRVNVNSALQTDPQKFVLIFGGGYDTSQEDYTYTTDGVGNGDLHARAHHRQPAVDGRVHRNGRRELHARQDDQLDTQRHHRARHGRR